MGETAELVIALLAKDAASSVLGGIGSKLDSLGKAGDVAKFALAGLGAGLGLAVGAGLSFAKAAADEEQGVMRLHQAIRNLGEGYLDATDTIENNIAAMERTTAFSDGEMRDSLSLLVGMTGDLDESMSRLPIAMDLARGAGIDLGTATKLLGKLTDDNVGVLKKYGVVVKDGADATDVLAAVQAKFGGQAQAFASSATGKWQIFNNQVDNLKENIGGALLPVFSGLATVATGAIDGINAALNNPMIAGAIAGLQEGLANGLSIFQEFFGVITGSAPNAGAALTAAIGPDAAKMIMGGLAFLRDMVKAVMTGDIPGALSTLGQRVPELVGQLLSFLGAAVPKIGAALLQWGKEMIAWIGPQIPPMLAELLKLLSTGLQWLGDHAPEIGETLVQWGLKFGEFIVTTAIPALIENLGPLLLTIGTWVVTEGIPGVIRFFFGLGQGIIHGILEGLGGLKTAIWNALVAAFQGIDFWVGPFHVTGHGISVQMPEFHFPELPHFDAGGVVPGPFGAPRLVVAHGGERFIPAGGGGGVARATGAPQVIQLVVSGRVLAEVVSDQWVDGAAMRGRRL